MLEEAEAGGVAPVESAEVDTDEELVGEMQTVEQAMREVTESADIAPAKAVNDASLDGDQLADQIQQMLDEASEAVEAGMEPGAGAAEVAARPDVELPAESQTPEQVMAQIDASLVEESDGIMAGDFESVDEVVHGAKRQQTQEMSAAESDEDAMPEGEMQSVDDALDDMLEGHIQTAAAAAEEAVEKKASEASEPMAARESTPADEGVSAAAVAAELDADERAAKPTPSQKTEPPAAPAATDEEAPSDAVSARPSALLMMMAMINGPLMTCSDTIRNFVGFLAVTLIFWGVCLISHGVAGMLVTMIVVMLGLPMVGLAFYMMFLRGGATDEPPATNAPTPAA